MALPRKSIGNATANTSNTNTDNHGDKNSSFSKITQYFIMKYYVVLNCP